MSAQDDRRTLPPFPVDDATLDLLWSAIFPGEGAERSSVSDLLTLYSRLGGSDTEAVAAEDDNGLRMMRDPQYHSNDVLVSLIEEIRRLRTAQQNDRGYRLTGHGLWYVTRDGQQLVQLDLDLFIAGQPDGGTPNVAVFGAERAVLKALLRCAVEMLDHADGRPPR